MEKRNKPLEGTRGKGTHGLKWASDPRPLDRRAGGLSDLRPYSPGVERVPTKILREKGFLEVLV